jgi:hypothetical protein
MSKTETMEIKNTTLPQTIELPRPARDQVVTKIVRDSQQDAQNYLDECIVPGGGE